MMNSVDPSQAGNSNNVFGLADVEPQKTGEQVEERRGFLDQLGKDVTVTLPKLKVSSDKKSKGFDRVSLSARKVMISEEVKTELRDARTGTVVKQLKKLTAKVWRFLSGQRWKKIPVAKRDEILKPLSEIAWDEVKGKMDSYDKAIVKRDELKKEWEGLAKRHLEYKHDFGVALKMYKVVMGKEGEIPHAKGLVFAVPANNDGSEKEYIQLGKNSEAENLLVANQIAKGLKNHPSFDKYLKQETRMNEIEDQRDGLLTELKELEAGIPGLVKEDANKRGVKRKGEATEYIDGVKNTKIQRIEEHKASEAKEMDKNIEFAESSLTRLVSEADAIKSEVDTLKGNLKSARKVLKDVKADIATMDQTNRRVKTEIARSGMSLDGLLDQKATLEAQIKADDKTLGDKSQDLKGRREYIAQAKKTLVDKKAERDGVYKQAKDRKAAAENEAGKALTQHSRKIDKEGSDEVANTKKAVTGRPD